MKGFDKSLTAIITKKSHIAKLKKKREREKEYSLPIKQRVKWILVLTFVFVGACVWLLNPEFISKNVSFKIGNLLHGKFCQLLA